jgi:hypothetical protein
VNDPRRTAEIEAGLADALDRNSQTSLRALANRLAEEDGTALKDVAEWMNAPVVEVR